MSAKGQIAIVTGGHKGIGKEIVRGLLAKRAKVYIATRNPSKCSEAKDELMADNPDAQVFYYKCDMGDFESISRFVKWFVWEEKKLHILVNNSEVVWGPRRNTKHGIELQLGINHVGHFFMTNLLMDHLKATDNRVKTCKSTKVIALTNVAHIIGKIHFDDLNWEKSYSSTRAYAQSKLANILWARDLAQRLDGTGIVVNAVNPGIVAIALSQERGWKGYKTPAEGAILPLKLALDDEYALETGQLFGDHNKDLTLIQERASRDMKVAARLWTATEKLIQSHQEYIPVPVVVVPKPEVEGEASKPKAFDVEMLKDPQSLVGWISTQKPDGVPAVVP